MDRNVELVTGLAVMAALALAALAVYRWRQRRRAHRIEAWVRAYLVDRYGELPGQLHIDCSDDTRWPVLVTFVAPLTGVRQRFQFACGGRPSTFALASEKEDGR